MGGATKKRGRRGGGEDAAAGYPINQTAIKEDPAPGYVYIINNFYRTINSCMLQLVPVHVGNSTLDIIDNII